MDLPVEKRLEKLEAVAQALQGPIKLISSAWDMKGVIAVLLSLAAALFAVLFAITAWKVATIHETVLNLNSFQASLEKIRKDQIEAARKEVSDITGAFNLEGASARAIAHSICSSKGQRGYAITVVRRAEKAQTCTGLCKAQTRQNSPVDIKRKAGSMVCIGTVTFDISNKRYSGMQFFGVPLGITDESCGADALPVQANNIFGSVRFQCRPAS